MRDKNKIIIAIDGPAGSGKSTTARETARLLNYIYIDTGAMYRAVTLAWLHSKTEMTSNNLREIVDNIKIELQQSPSGQLTLLNNIDVSDDIRLPEVTKYVSPVSADGYVREKMVEIQRRIGQNGGVVMDGRDIGTVVFPDAELKIFLVASIEARAKRRAAELSQKGIDFSIDEIKKQIEERDNYDSTREISPLKKAQDAIEIDTSNITIQDQTQLVYDLAIEVIG